MSEFVLIRLGTAVTDSHVRLRTGADRQSRMVSDSRVRVRNGSRGVERYGLVRNVMAVEECQGELWTGCERSGSHGKDCFRGDSFVLEWSGSSG